MRRDSSRKLTINKETLRELSARDLKVAAGGELTPDIKTLPIDQCFVIIVPTAGGECIPQ